MPRRGVNAVVIRTLFVTDGYSSSTVLEQIFRTHDSRVLILGATVIDEKWELVEKQGSRSWAVHSIADAMGAVDLIVAHIEASDPEQLAAAFKDRPVIWIRSEPSAPNELSMSTLSRMDEKSLPDFIDAIRREATKEKPLPLSKGVRIEFRTFRDGPRLYRATIADIAIGGETVSLTDIAALIDGEWQPASVGLGSWISRKGLRNVRVV